MSFLQSLILGIIQGLTEFLPISSSAHLVLVPYLFNWRIPENQIFPFDVLVQIGTLLAVIIYFRKDLWSIIREFVRALIKRKPFETFESRMGWYLILATIPAGVAGVFLKDRVEAAFNNPRMTAIFLFVTAFFLLAAEFFSRRSRKLAQMNWLDALVAGIFQAFSIFPGISRSGSTITGGMLRHLDRPVAARFAFLMSIPVMIAAGVFSIPDLLDVPNLGQFLPILIIGFLTAAVVGYLSIKWLLAFLNKRSLVYFALYCILLATAVLIIAGIRPVNAEIAVEPTPEPTQNQPIASVTDQILQLDTSPATDWLLPIASKCVENIPGLSIVVNPTSPNINDELLTSVDLYWGEPTTTPENAFVLVEDELMIIVNSQNPIDKLPTARLAAILDGSFTTWGDLLADCPNCYSETPAKDLLDLPIQLYFYSNESDAQTTFNAYFDTSTRVINTSMIVPTTAAMIEAVLSDPASLGFIPARARDDAAVLAVNLTESGETYTIKAPLLAITSGEPQELVSQWLVCIQDELNP